MTKAAWLQFWNEHQIKVLASVHMENNTCWVNDNLVLEAQSTPDLCAQLYKHLELNYPKFHKMDRLCKLGILAAEMALASESKPLISPYKVAMVFQNSSASYDNDTRYQETIADHASPALFVYTLPNIVIGEVAIRHGIKGENTFFVSKEINREELAQYAITLFQQNIADRLLCAYIDFEEDHQQVEMYWLSK